MSAGNIILGATGGGGLLRITSFTSSGTWTKQADVSKVLVFCVGGGGGGGGINNLGNGGTGGTTSFAGFCSAVGGGGGLQNGGSSGAARQGGSGGSSGVGDLILLGQSGSDGVYQSSAYNIPGTMGGSSAVGGYGSGGRGGYNLSLTNPSLGKSFSRWWWCMCNKTFTIVIINTYSRCNYRIWRFNTWRCFGGGRNTRNSFYL
jgi:hypothetical protein